MKSFALLCATILALTVSAAEDPTFGSWSLGSPAPDHLLATHSSLLRNGKILVVGGSSYNCCFSWGKEEARLYDIAANSWSGKLPSPAPYAADKDAFCSGHAHDDRGGVIFQGGLLGYWELNGHGIGNSARYDVTGGTFTQLGLSATHWYPTLAAGPGEMFIFPGRETDVVHTAEGNRIHKMAYGTSTWTSTGVEHWTKSTYPRVSLLPDGKFFIASPGDSDRKNYFFDPKTNTISLAGNDLVPESDPSGIHCCEAWKGTGVLLPLVPSMGGYPSARFALINGNNSYVKELLTASPAWQIMGTRPPELGSPSVERNFANSTLLPTGQVFVNGGVGPEEHDSVTVAKPEIYDVETNSWLLTSAATVPRNYHAVALLLPDGRVWTASASQDHEGSECREEHGCKGPERTEERVEIFTPWYVGRSDRPQLTGCPGTTVSDGRQFSIGIGASAGTSVSRVVLMRAGSPTHAYDSDQRLIQLDLVGTTASTVTVKSPYSANAAPPGDYMLFALRKIAETGFKRWVPSQACWMRVLTSPRIDGAPIWSYTGTPCSGTNCPGWRKLDNNAKTVAIAATGTHHEQILYQLHNDGWIWRYTGAPCDLDACPGWQRLDNNAKTVAIAAAGTQFYQLHNDGAVWRYLGLPCTGDSCPGWERLDNNSKTVAIAAGGNQLYQLQNDGWIWRYTNTPCTGESCPGWQRLDRNSKTVAISAAGSSLYQLHNDGWIFRYTGTPCSGETCSGWQRLDRNSKAVGITAASDKLYQLHNDGWVWRYTGAPCSGETCPGWERLDNNSRTSALTATGTSVFQLHNDGRIFRSTGTACAGETCPGWQQLDNNARTGMIAAGDPAAMASGSPLYQLHTDPLYQMHNNGALWRYIGFECEGTNCPGWQRLDNNPKTIDFAAAGGQLFQLHNDGRIWRYTGKPCSGATCPGWQMLDKNPRSKAIVAGGIQLFQLHHTGEIWRYLGRPCSGDTCTGWQRLDRNAKTVAIAASATQLFQLHNDGKIWRYTGTPCSGDTCTGWQMLDSNANAKSIVAAGNQLFQLHGDGKIWRYTGTPCSGASCPGWQLLDSNAKTTAIVSGGTQLYQLHNDGRVWRYTGKPCAGTSCPGWERLDNNAATRQIVATGDHLYQRHEDGRLWRYIGPACTGETCPGWRMLDNNPQTKRITTGGFQ
jgi:hypothetical protein